MTKYLKILTKLQNFLNTELRLKPRLFGSDFLFPSTHRQLHDSHSHCAVGDKMAKREKNSETIGIAGESTSINVDARSNAKHDDDDKWHAAEERLKCEGH